MLQKTQGIVLRSIKHSDTRLIVTIFTEAFGPKAYIVNANRSKKGNKNAMFYRAGMLLDLVVYEKEKSSVQRIKEATFAHSFSDLIFNPVKISVLFFITETLGIVTNANQAEPEMFRFVRSLLLMLDAEENSVHGYLYYFLIKLTRYLGFYPLGNSTEETPVFDMANGRFTGMPPSHGNYISGSEAEMFGMLLNFLPGKNNGPAKNKKQRLQLLEHLLNYYKLHYPSFKEIKSMEVMRRVFS